MREEGNRKKIWRKEGDKNKRRRKERCKKRQQEKGKDHKLIKNQILVFPIHFQSMPLRDGLTKVNIILIWAPNLCLEANTKMLLQSYYLNKRSTTWLTKIRKLKKEKLRLLNLISRTKSTKCKKKSWNASCKAKRV